MEVTAGLGWAGSATSKHTSSGGVNNPPLAVPAIDGKTTQVHKRRGKVVLVDFTTRPNCKQPSAGSQVLYQESGEKGFLPVAIMAGAQAWRALPLYRSLCRLTFPVDIVEREEVLRYLNHPADKPMFVPILVLLAKQGRISMKEIGWIGEQKLRSANTGAGYSTPLN